MKKSLFIVLATFALTSSLKVLANDVWYIGALYNKQDVSTFSHDFKSAGLILGYQYNKYLSLETRLSTGTSGYTSLYGPTKGDYKEDIDTQSSFLIKATYPIFKSFNVYGLAGYSNTAFEVKFSADDKNADILAIDQTETASGFSYGIGLNYQINKQFNIFVDYQVLPEITFFSKGLRSTSIGVNYCF
jgi:opacity protein-like surface antigen